MPTNFYFNNFPQHQITSEQLLVEDLVIEAMQIHGMDVYYLPQTSRDQVDMLYGEDTLKEFRSAYGIEMYLENVSGMDGEGDFISKFGLEIRDEVTLLMSRRRFSSLGTSLTRPREGVYVYALKLKQFVFSEEIISTGVDEIDDQIFDSYKRASLPLANTTIFPAGTGSFVPGEIIYQGSSLATANAQAIVHSYTAHSSISIIQVRGSFATGNVRGNTSSALRSAISYNDDTQVGNSIFEDIADNVRIETESDGILDFTEHNPFGEA